MTFDEWWKHYLQTNQKRIGDFFTYEGHKAGCMEAWYEREEEINKLQQQINFLLKELQEGQTYVTGL